MDWAAHQEAHEEEGEKVTPEELAFHDQMKATVRDAIAKGSEGQKEQMQLLIDVIYRQPEIACWVAALALIGYRECTLSSEKEQGS